jgi:glutamate---cysteine ligase / carboxylate-amine ligase
MPEGDRHRTEEIPAWARWSEAAADRPWTVGIEEEVMLLQASDGSLANRIDDVLTSMPPALAGHASAETHACVLELKTSAHATVAEAVEQLGSFRRSVDRRLRGGFGLCLAAGGTHPLATRSEVTVSALPRYREVEAETRILAHREPTMALHVHVAVPNGLAAVRALDGLRGDLPLLLALSANSPFWRRCDSGFASIRIPIFSMFPRVGIAPHFGSYLRYVRAVDPLIRSTAIPDSGFLWWDARLRPRLGTVEVRIMDAQSRLADVASLAALVHCLVCRHADGRSISGGESELLAQNRFLAARDGLGGRLIDAETGGLRSSRDALDDLLADCEELSLRLDCHAELMATADLAADPGDGRQRGIAARHGLDAVPARLAQIFVPAARTAVAV